MQSEDPLGTTWSFFSHYTSGWGKPILFIFCSEDNTLQQMECRHTERIQLPSLLPDIKGLQKATMPLFYSPDFFFCCSRKHAYFSLKKLTCNIFIVFKWINIKVIGFNFYHGKCRYKSYKPRSLGSSIIFKSVKGVLWPKLWELYYALYYGGGKREERKLKLGGSYSNPYDTAGKGK